MASTYTLSSYSLATIAVTVAASSATPTYIWQTAIPSGLKGKSAILQLFFNLYVATNFFAGQSFSYGIYVDGVSLAIGDATTVSYTHTAATPYAINSGGFTRGTNAFTGFSPLIIPVTFSASASIIQIGISNSSLAMSAISSASPYVTSNIVTATGTVGSNNYYPATIFTTGGSGLFYTVPTTVYSSVGTSNNVVGVFVYCWGGTGASYAGNSGSAGFASGFYSCAGGTVLRYIVALNDSGGNANTGGSGQGNGVGGGAFSGIFLSNAGGVVQSNALIVAGGGGQSGGSQAGGGGGGGGAAASNASGTGFCGSAGYIYSSGFTSITGGTLTAGGSGTYAGSALVGGGNAGGAAAGGGGYFGGGGQSGFNTTQAGGGGSSFVANTVTGAAFSPGMTAQNVSSNLMPPGGTANPYYVSNTTYYGYGGSNVPNSSGQYGYGLIAIVPAVGASANQIGVQASVFTV